MGRLQCSVVLIDDMMRKCSKPYISLSFGKDSVAMTRLILSLYPETVVIYVNCGEFDEWPDTERVKNAFLKKLPCEFYEIYGPSIIEYYRQAGYAYVQDEQTGKRANKAQREYGASLAMTIEARAKELECDGVFMGLRRDESWTRGHLFRKRGAMYYAKTRQAWTCCPIERWSAKDVWAYIVKYDLPWNELYDLDPRGREIARNGAMIGTRSARYGRLSMLKQMYPVWWNRFVDEFPDIARWI